MESSRTCPTPHQTRLVAELPRHKMILHMFNANVFPFIVLLISSLISFLFLNNLSCCNVKAYVAIPAVASSTHSEPPESNLNDCEEVKHPLDDSWTIVDTTHPHQKKNNLIAMVPPIISFTQLTISVPKALDTGTYTWYEEDIHSILEDCDVSSPSSVHHEITSEHPLA